MSDGPASWRDDPSGRHEHRYWDGDRWTDHVADRGIAAEDAWVEPEPEAEPELEVTEPDGAPEPAVLEWRPPVATPEPDPAPAPEPPAASQPEPAPAPAPVVPSALTGWAIGRAAPAEPSSTRPSPTQPSPTQPSPVQPSPTHPSPVAPNPITEPTVVAPAVAATPTQPVMQPRVGQPSPAPTSTAAEPAAATWAATRVEGAPPGPGQVRRRRLIAAAVAAVALVGVFLAVRASDDDEPDQQDATRILDESTGLTAPPFGSNPDDGSTVPTDEVTTDVTNADGTFNITPEMRAQLIVGFQEGLGLTEEQAECTADAVIDGLESGELKGDSEMEVVLPFARACGFEGEVG